MAQPPEATEPVERLLAAWERAQARLEAEQNRVIAKIADTTSRERKRALERRLTRIETELLAVVDEEMLRLRALTSDYLTTELPATWKLGAQVANPTSFVWSAPHRAGLTAMVNDTWSDVLAATEYVSADAKRFLGDAGARWSELRFTTGISPQEARREFLRDAKVRGIKSVRYSNGSERTVGDYGDMLLRTKQAVAYSTGTIIESKELGFTHLRVFDGTGCGWASHGGTPTADGLIVPVDMAAATPVSHPRAFLGGQTFAPLGAVRQVVRGRYSGPAVSIRTSESGDLAVTPDHPILTSRGWVLAGEVNPGDHVLSYSGRGERFDMRPCANFAQHPEVGHDDFPALVEVGRHSRVVATSDDLHYAAQFCEPEIDVVDVDLFLWNHLHPLGLEGSRDGGLGSVLLADRLQCCSPVEASLVRDGRSSAGGMCASDLAPPCDGVGSFRPDVGAGLAPGAKGVPLSAKGRPDGTLAYAQPVLVDDLLRGQSRQVEPVHLGQKCVVELGGCWHRVTSCIGFQYTGSVYDASTADDAYVVNGFVVANCRRAFGPVVVPEGTPADAVL